MHIKTFNCKIHGIVDAKCVSDIFGNCWYCPKCGQEVLYVGPDRVSYNNLPGEPLDMGEQVSEGGELEGDVNGS